SSGWLAYRAPLAAGGDGVFARNISNPAAPGPVQTLATVGGSGRLSAPGVDGTSLVYAVARVGGSRIVQRVLGTRKRRTLVRSGRLLLYSPAIKGRSFVYTRTDGRRSRLLIRRVDKRGSGKVLYSIKRSRATLWSASLSQRFAYVTVLNPSSASSQARIVKTPRKAAKRGRLGARPPRGGGNHRF
ncbi:MAG: hypothetical protein M3O25_05625, partial [Actinomycetota bacterium]|nr:hypothetical protein [Actinomycetota bacterium]